ncbi:hypothetical protein X989_5897 [Burkholderia pseudomallei MSHR4378]|nr:hypothetical protein X989_5897 [Burkholderia pseudomallei MSHR4378]
MTAAIFHCQITTSTFLPRADWLPLLALRQGESCPLFRSAISPAVSFARKQKS